VFKVGGEEFAVDIMLTNEVVLMRDITPVPETEGYVEGVMNLRGNLVPVLDFRKRLRALGTTAFGTQDNHRKSRRANHRIDSGRGIRGNKGQRGNDRTRPRSRLGDRRQLH